MPTASSSPGKRTTEPTTGIVQHQHGSSNSIAKVRCATHSCTSHHQHAESQQDIDTPTPWPMGRKIFSPACPFLRIYGHGKQCNITDCASHSLRLYQAPRNVALIQGSLFATTSNKSYRCSSQKQTPSQYSVDFIMKKFRRCTSATPHVGRTMERKYYDWGILLAPSA